MNINIYAGNICNDITLQQTTGGINYSRFTIAIKRPMTDDKTDFIPCIAWRNTAEFVSKYFKKGDKILVNGYMTTQKYEDKEGKQKTSFEVCCSNIEFCQQSKKTKSIEDLEKIEDGEDLPF